MACGRPKTLRLSFAKNLAHYRGIPSRNVTPLSSTSAVLFFTEWMPMKAKDLIEKLQTLDPDTEILVYGHASVSAEHDFVLDHNLHDQNVRLIPPYYKG